MTTMYRDSRFVDFNKGTVVLDPVAFVTSHESPRGFHFELDFFECRVEVWQLLPAVEILKQIEAHEPPSAWSHSAFSLLFILAPYFEMVGKILNENSNEYRSSESDFNIGFRSVYPEHPFSERVANTTGFKDDAFPYIGQLRDRLRNGLSHVGFVKKAIEIHNSPNFAQDFEVVGVVGNPSEPNPSPIAFYLANPHKFTRTVVAHFDGFVRSIRDSDERTREKFMEFVNDFHEPRSIHCP